MRLGGPKFLVCVCVGGGEHVRDHEVSVQNTQALKDLSRHTDDKCVFTRAKTSSTSLSMNWLKSQKVSHIHMIALKCIC